MSETVMNIIRDVYDDEGRLIDEIDIRISLVFLEEQRQTWGDPGSPEEISIGNCIDASGNAVELTPCEEEYVYNNLQKHLQEMKEEAQIGNE